MLKPKPKKLEKQPCGWREWVSLPDLGVSNIKVKLDTGAKTSALHAYDITYSRHGKKQFVHFKIHPKQRNDRYVRSAKAEVVEFRHIKNSGGGITERPVIHTTLKMGDRSWEIELTLTNRDEMGFRMLLGRQAMHRRLVIDPSKSYLQEKKG